MVKAWHADVVAILVSGSVLCARRLFAKLTGVLKIIEERLFGNMKTRRSNHDVGQGRKPV